MRRIVSQLSSFPTLGCGELETCRKGLIARDFDLSGPPFNFPSAGKLECPPKPRPRRLPCG